MYSRLLSRQWFVAENQTLMVTACLVGGDLAGWASLSLIAGTDYFPECLPQGEQLIAGMAMLETTVRCEFPQDEDNTLLIPEFRYAKNI